MLRIHIIYCNLLQLSFPGPSYLYENCEEQRAHGNTLMHIHRRCVDSYTQVCNAWQYLAGIVCVAYLDSSNDF